MKLATTFITVLALSMFGCKEETVKLSHDQLATKYYWQLSSLTIIEHSAPYLNVIMTDTNILRFHPEGKLYSVLIPDLGVYSYPEIGNWKVLNGSILQLGATPSSIISWDENELIYVLVRDLGTSGTVKLEIKRKALKINTP